jgi:hypothetical protein
LVFDRSKQRSEEIVDSIKVATTTAMTDAMALPPGCDANHSPWADGRWIKYLDSEAAIKNAIAHVIENPLKDGKPQQKWPFTVPFPGIEPGSVSYNV